jgi:acyl dehydratase
VRAGEIDRVSPRIGDVHVVSNSGRETAVSIPEFDPQPFHLDEHAAKRSVFGGLAASGWHTTALTMRLLVDSDLRIAGGLIGLGFEELRWPRPVRPGDELRVESLVLEKRESKSRPQQGLLKMRNTTINQHDEPVQLSVGTLIVPRRA